MDSGSSEIITLESINDKNDLPTLEHEQAVDALQEKLKDELTDATVIRISGKTKLNGFGIEWKGAVPDLIARHNDKKMIIVEVGSTEAEKIPFYLSRPLVTEVRWYDRCLNLIGQWSKNGQGQLTAITFDEALKCQVKKKSETIFNLSQQITNLRQKQEEYQTRNEDQNKKLKDLKTKLFNLSPKGEAKEEREYSIRRRKERLFRKQLFDDHISNFNKEMLEILFVLFNQRAENVYLFCPNCFSKVSFWNASIISNSNGASDILVCQDCKYVPSIPELEQKLAKVNEWHNERFVSENKRNYADG